MNQKKNNGSILEPAPVALTEREAGELVQTECTNPPNYKLWIIQLLQQCSINSKIVSPKEIEKKYKKLYRATPLILSVAQYVRLNTITIGSVIAEELDIPERTVYSIINKLKKWGLVKKGGKLSYRHRKGIKGGPAPEIISWYETTTIPPELIAQLNEKYYNEVNPAMKEIKRIIPMLIDEYVDPIDKEIKYIQIVSEIKKVLPGYSFNQLADECSNNLQKIGIKVWR